MTELRAVTTPLSGDVDLNDVAGDDGYLFVRDGVGVAGRGVAARVGADAVATLAAIDHDDRAGLAGCGPVAIGCVPYRPGSEPRLVIPSVIVGRDADGHRWRTDVFSAADGPPTGEVPRTPTPEPAAGSFTVAPITPVETYLAAVAAARDAVRDGQLVKAVIAREVGITADAPISVRGVLARLRAGFGSSYRYSIDGLVGASPELLVEVRGDMVRSHPLAGTAPRTGDPNADARIAAALIGSMKDQVEHRVVIDVVHDTLLPYCSYLDWEPEPTIVAVANVQHLGTAIEGRLSQPAPDALELARLLSPTPALGGHPRDEALALIERVEGVDRGRYGGTVGWVDASGSGCWAVTIRCAELSDDRRHARLVAGGGIVAESVPTAELAETQAKLQAMLGAIVRP
jgi:menaquinone-specific isochorismate synthase